GSKSEIAEKIGGCFEINEGKESNAVIKGECAEAVARPREKKAAAAKTPPPPPRRQEMRALLRLLPLPAFSLAIAAGVCPCAGAATSDPAPLVQADLDAKMPEEIGRVSVTADAVAIRGTLKGSPEGLALAEIPIERLLSDPDRYADLVTLDPGGDGGFQAKVPRFIDRDGKKHDRLLSKWQLVRKTAEGRVAEPVSHARFSDDIACRAPDLPEAKPKSKKGLGGWSAAREPLGELERLGITSITVNVMIQDMLSLENTPGRTPYLWEGRTYYVQEDRLKGYDATFTEAARHGVMVSAILLVPNPVKGGDATVKLLGHPDATAEGIFAMPNVTSADGMALYGAIVNFMAERWSRPDGAHGRVHHWILHNEVDAGWTWTNCGVKEAASFMDLYYRSMRITDLLIRQYDPHAKAFISLTHYWTGTADGHSYASRNMLELLSAFSRNEGNFAWGVAYHPYPQSLFNPRTWEDNEATLSFDTKKITPRNLEVLDAWMRQPAMLGPQGEVRTVHLSENGFNSPDYSEISLRDQAAGMAYAWKKIEKLGAIQAWMYHNWVDNRGEGGLKIGLRKFPDEPGHPLEPKPIWKLYQALGTAEEDPFCEPYLSVTKLSSWDNIVAKWPPP
ncbi:MAG: hypothetical protein JWO82_2624, partial [Akkermansiaceae bacterium]|nr:hypothetical protein [Akkermansiaceae bacterium]